MCVREQSQVGALNLQLLTDLKTLPHNATPPKYKDFEATVPKHQSNIKSVKKLRAE
jgi:hypothetical protein